MVLDQARAESLQKFLKPAITIKRLENFSGDDWLILQAGDARLSELGINVVGSCCVAISSLNRVGNVRVTANAGDSLIVFDTRHWQGVLQAEVTMAAVHASVIFSLSGKGVIALPTVLLRSANQLFFWGDGSTSVQSRISIEGAGHSVVVGDDALLSSGIWLRNYDMHALIDLDTMDQINKPVDTVIEKHVWLGQDVFLIACPLVGGGSVIGAKALVKSSVPRKVAFGGLPGRVLRKNISWGRSTQGMNASEVRLISTLDDDVG